MPETFAEKFAAPGAAYRGKPFWSWNGRLEPEKLRRQIREFKAMGLGGFFMQLDTVDTQTLLEAQKDPQKYKTLSVRVSGWNARFVTLNKEWQNMIIERSSQNCN